MVRSSLIVVAAALRWSAPEPCPQGAALQERLAATVGPALAQTADAEVTVTRDAEGRFVANLRVGDGQRTLDEATCDVLADAVVTVVSLSLGAPPPPPAPAAPSATPPPVPETETEEPPRERRSAVSRSAPASRPDPTFAVGALLRIEHGTLPSTAVSGGVGAAWYPLRAWRIEGSLFRSLGQSQAVSNEDFGGSFHLTAGTVRTCWSPLAPVPTVSTLTVGPCAGVDLDHVDASGYGSAHVEDGSSTWWAPSAGAVVSWQPLGRLAITALGDVAFAASRRSFVITDGGSIYRPAVATPRGHVAVEVRF